MKQNNFPGGSEGKESAFNSGDLGFNLWVRKIPWRSEWLPIDRGAWWDTVDGVAKSQT